MKMKQITTGLCALALLAGCTDASAKLANSSETVMTVGSKSFTKGEVYSMMMASIGYEEVYTDALNYISEQEVEVTDDMRSEAENTVEMYKMLYGDQFTSYLESSGMSEEDYVNDVILASQRSSALPEVYVKENFDTLVATYEPIKAIILSFSASEDASAAISALKDGSKTAAEAASENNSTSTGEEEVITNAELSYDSTVMSVLRSGSVDDGWVEIPSSDGATFYVVKIVSKDANEFKDDAVSALSTLSAVTSASTDHFFRKYNFHIYDITVYNGIKENHPEILVQDSDPVAVPTPAPTEEAAEATAETTGN